MSDYAIELRNVTKRYGDLVANDDITLQIRRGELMTLLGPSGCGKTTALRCITGHNIPDRGEVWIDGQNVTDVPTHRRELGMVFQNFALFPHMTVFDNVEFPLMIRRTDKSERQKHVLEALRLIRMERYADHYPRQLSGGQQQRVGLARALVYRPKVLLLDEPLSNLDAKLREEMRFEIRDLIDRLSITAVYVTHDQAEALALSDRVAVMNAGRIEQIGTPDQIYECPESRFVADFIGLSDFIAGTVSDLHPAQGTAIIAAHGLEILAPATPEMSVGQRVLLFTRPNNVDLFPASEARADDVNVFPGVVDKMTYLGDRNDYRIIVGDGADDADRSDAFCPRGRRHPLEIRVQTDGKVRFRVGEHVNVRLPMPLCRVLVEPG